MEPKVRDILEVKISENITLQGILYEEMRVQWRMFPPQGGIIDYTEEDLTKLRRAMRKMEKTWGM